jgi:hypothetical protein
MPVRDIKSRRSCAGLRYVRCAGPGFKDGYRIFQRAGKFEVFGRVGKIDHLLIIAQLQPIQAGADKFVRQQSPSTPTSNNIQNRVDKFP